jgi:hypothetical protein
VFWFSLQFLAETFLILRRTEHSTVRNCIGLHVKYLLFFQILIIFRFYYQIFEKIENFIKHKHVFRFSLQRLFEIFLILRRTEHSTVRNCIGLHVKYHLFFQILMKFEILSSDFRKIPKYEMLRHGRGTVWARHGMCELALTQRYSDPLSNSACRHNIMCCYWRNAAWYRFSILVTIKKSITAN